MNQLNRITAGTEGPVGNSSSGRWGQTYTIDAWGNLTKQLKTKGTIPEFDQTANSSNRIVGYCYDAAGNLLKQGSCGTADYAYDAESRLTTAGGYTYTYDANGQRVRKYQNASPNNWTEYIYFNGQVIAEKDQAGTWTDYIFAGGKRIAKAPGVSATTGTEFYHSDHLGSSRLMTNAQGTVIPGSEATFAPYGEELPSATTTSNHYKFTGKERDAESGTDYFGARYYGPGIGRWLTPDWSDDPEPIPYADLTDPQTLNLYGYVGNRPITNADLDGHCWPISDCTTQAQAAISRLTETAFDAHAKNGSVGLAAAVSTAGELVNGTLDAFKAGEAVGSCLDSCNAVEMADATGQDMARTAGLLAMSAGGGEAVLQKVTTRTLTRAATEASEVVGPGRGGCSRYQGSLAV